jgi:hypothetical protein
MKIRLNEDYYFWCCDWCDSENLMHWATFQTESTNCGACHRPMRLPDENGLKRTAWSSIVHDSIQRRFYEVAPFK